MNEDMEQLAQELRTLSMETRASLAEIRTSLAELRLDVVQRFGALMEAVADLRNEYRGHTHEEGE